MDKYQLVNRIKEAFKIFTNIELIVLFKNEHLGGYNMIFSSKNLDNLSPYDSVLKVVKFISRHDDDLKKDINGIFTVHSKDENIQTLKEFMFNIESDYFIENENFEMFGTIVNDGAIIKFT